MAKVPSTILTVIMTFIAFGATGTPIAENWTSQRGSYNVHATWPDRFVLEHDQNSSTKPIAKFTVMPGDIFQKSSGERSEVVLGGWESTSRFQVKGNEGTEFYRVSVKLASDWKAPETNSRGFAWGSFFQLHGPNEYGVASAVAIFAESKFSLFVVGGDVNGKGGGGRRFLTKSDLNVGTWVDFVLKIKWAPDTTGAISVYRRDEGEPEWVKVADIKELATLQRKGNLIKPHYWKAGIYRSESNHVNTLWLGPILRGRTFSEVAGQ